MYFFHVFIKILRYFKLNYKKILNFKLYYKTFTKLKK